MNGAMTLFYSFDEYNHFGGNGGTFKVSLLQRYEVLWIHNIDAICKTVLLSLILKKIP